MLQCDVAPSAGGVERDLAQMQPLGLAGELVPDDAGDVLGRERSRLPRDARRIGEPASLLDLGPRLEALDLGAEVLLGRCELRLGLELRDLGLQVAKLSR